MRAGHLLLLPAETLHCELYEKEEWPRVGWIGAAILDADVPAEAFCRAIPVNAEQLGELERVLIEVSREQSARGTGWREVIDLELRRLLLLIGRWARAAPRPRVEEGEEIEPLPARTREILESAADWMATHCADPLRVTEVAARYHLSAAHFSALFRKGIGISPKKYLLSARLARARWLLERGQQTQAVIAQECGFYDEAHFHRVFKQYVGHAPGKEEIRAQ